MSRAADLEIWRAWMERDDTDDIREDTLGNFVASVPADVVAAVARLKASGMTTEDMHAQIGASFLRQMAKDLTE